MSDGNRWMEMVGHRGCIYPCSGEPVLKTEPGEVWVAAHALPEYLQCSECGHAPLPEDQPALLAEFRSRCQCEELEFDIHVNRFEDLEFQVVEIRMRCNRCLMVGRFLGMDNGVGTGGTPKVSMFSEESRMPFVVDLPAALWDKDGPPLSEEDREVVGRVLQRTITPSIDFTVTRTEVVDRRDVKIEAMRLVLSALAVKAEVDDDRLVELLEKAEADVETEMMGGAS